MDENTKINFLKDEYFKLQDFYEDYDKRLLGIKGWSVTIAVVAIGAGFQNKMPNLWLFASITSVVFLTLELFWKTFQHCYSPRIEELEEVFRNGRFDKVQPLQIYYSWEKALRNQKKKFLDILKIKNVYFPHLITFVAGITLFVLHYFNYI